MKNILIVLLALFCSTYGSAFANKTSVEVKTPAEVKKGTEVTLVINVSHSSNSKGHHTDWVVLRINGKEVKRWTFDKGSLPPDSVFTVEYKVVAEEDLTIESEGHCNLHGSKGISKTVVKIAS